MPIDATIPLAARALQVPNALNALAQAVQIQGAQDQRNLAQYQLAKARRDDTRAEAVSAAYRGAFNPDGSLNKPKVISGLADAGAGDAIPGTLKQFTDMESAQHNLAKSQWELMNAKHKFVTDEFAKLPTNANSGDVMRMFGELVAKGALTRDQAIQGLAAVPNDPEEIKQWVQQKNMEGLSAKERLEAMKPHRVDLGDRLANDNPLVQVPDLPKSATPDALMTDRRTREEGAVNRANASSIAAAGRQVTMRGQDMVDSRARAAQDAASRAVTYQPDENGGVQALPSRLAPGEMPVGRPAVDASGNPIRKAEKPAPQFVIEGVEHSSRAVATIDKALQQLSTPAGKNALGLKNMAPGAVGRAIVNWKDPEGVETRANVADIGSLQIKDRSGATVTIGEEPRLVPFIPLPTDSPEVATKKLRRLRETIEGDMQSLGQFYPDALKKYEVAKASRQSSDVPRPTTAAERDALPAGTRYIAPDGSERVRR